MKTRENVFYRKSNFLHNNMKKSLLLGALALTLLALSPETVSAQSTPTTDYSSYSWVRVFRLASYSWGLQSIPADGTGALVIMTVTM